MNGFGGFNEFVFRVVMCQVRKRHASAEIRLINVEMLSFDFLPRAVLVRKISYKSNRNLVLDTLSVGLANRTKEQHPSFSLPTCFFL
jgi:hypothetical protein